jgi:hypothetical protein
MTSIGTGKEHHNRQKIVINQKPGKRLGEDVTGNQ